MRNNVKLQTNIEKFVEERLQESYENVQQKHDYKKIDKQYFELFQKVKKELGHDEELLEQYESALAQMYEIQLKEAYYTGANDMTQIFLRKEV